MGERHVPLQRIGPLQWNAVESAEKSPCARLAIEVTTALPVELSKEERIQLVEDFVGRLWIAE